MSDRIPLTASADGTPHFAYFIPEEQLSFVWNGRGALQVCYGGYGEPVIDEIPLEGGATAALAAFKALCDQWAEAHVGAMS